MPWQFKCPKCGKTSSNENDAKLGYCGKCHDFTRIMFNLDRCVAEGCTDHPRDRMVLCDRHWAMIPRELQQGFYRSRYKLEQGFAGGEALVGEALEKMRNACND